MNHSTNGKITLDIICQDNLCNFNIYTQIRKLNSQNIPTFIQVYLKTLDNHGRFSKDILSPSFAEATPHIAIINLGFHHFSTRDK